MTILMLPLYLVAYVVDVTPNDLPSAFWLVVGLIAARGLALLAQLRLRYATIAWVAVPVGVVAFAAVLVTEPGAAPERSREMNASFFMRSDLAPDEISIERRPSEQLRMDLSPRENLTGVDLRGRSLYQFYFAGKVMTYAELSYADLQRTNFFDAHLEGAVMKGAAARRTLLQRAHLRHATLVYADLREADLRWADLRDTDLRGANLTGADLAGARLQRTDLADAQLRSTNMRAAVLRRAKLASAILNCTVLEGADLRHVQRPAPAVFGATWTVRPNGPADLHVRANGTCSWLRPYSRVPAPRGMMRRSVANRSCTSSSPAGRDIAWWSRTRRAQHAWPT